MSIKAHLLARNKGTASVADVSSAEAVTSESVVAAQTGTVCVFCKQRMSPTADVVTRTCRHIAHVACHNRAVVHGHVACPKCPVPATPLDAGHSNAYRTLAISTLETEYAHVRARYGTFTADYVTVS